jgi:hypothetical protein
MVDKKKDIKLLVYLEDNGQNKDKQVIILEKDNLGIKVQIWDEINNKEVGTPFFLPWSRILKIKDKVKSGGSDDFK